MMSEQSSGRAMAKAVGIGAFLGLTWGASLRTWMVVLALEFGDYPRFTWDGTFLVILLPSTLGGAILGGAWYAAKRQASRHWRWAALAPALFVVGPLLFIDGFIPTLLEEGLGGGAIAVAIVGLLGGYGLSSHNRRWLRGLALLLAVVITLGVCYGLFFVGPIGMKALTARAVFGALYFALLMILLAIATAIPYQVMNSAEEGQAWA